MGSRDNFKLANQLAKELQSSVPRAVSARYDPKNKSIEIVLSSNLKVSFSPRHAQGLEKATPSQLQKIEISPSGFGIHFPRLDADLYLPAILQGFFGSRKWMASQAWTGWWQIEKRRQASGVESQRKTGRKAQTSRTRKP